MTFHLAISHSIERSGRWQASNTGSLIASWCGASLKFLHTGRSLSIKTGPLTERKDRFNGGTPMVACIISQDSEDDKIAFYDFEPSQTKQLFVARSEDEIGKQRTVELTLIDWASVLEIEAFIIPSTDDIRLPLRANHVRLLHIGDSISCGFSDGSTPIPRGCLDAFPFVVRDALRKEGVMMEIDMVAFPGTSLTDPTQEEIDSERNLPKGMETMFFHASPWSDLDYEGEQLRADILVVALGTNDDARDVEPIYYQTSLLALVSKIHELNVDTLKHLVILHPFPDFIDEDVPSHDTNSPLTVYIPSFVDTLRTRFPNVAVSACDIGQGIWKEYTMDGLHPTVDGQAILAAVWLDKARKIVKSVLGAH
ncbi:hypothetical protein C0995_015074 [Termitomyces sp. Mi166|nr:hypothetical protein C0995_015074 [Termitomyces sp. Mi166\